MWMTPSRSATTSPGSPMMRLTNAEPPSRKSTSVGRRGCVEHDDVSALGVAKSVGESVGDHAVAEASLAVLDGLGAMERWLHGRRRDAVRLGYLCLKRQDEGDCHGDSHEPVDDRPPRLRDPALGAIEDPHGHIDIVRLSSADVGSGHAHGDVLRAATIVASVEPMGGSTCDPPKRARPARSCPARSSPARTCVCVRRHTS